MTSILKSISRKVTGKLEAAQRRFRRARPGSILILVVALLVLLALMGTAYVATARLDRVSSGSMRDRGQLDEAALSILDDISSKYTDLVAKDRDRLTHPLGSAERQTVAPFQLQRGTTTTWLGSSDPILLANPVDGSVPALPATMVQGPTPAWRFISRPQANGGVNASMVTLYDQANSGLPLRYDDLAGPSGTPPTNAALQDYSWFTPTNFVVPYTLGSLKGRTRVYPAFHRVYFQGGAFIDDGVYMAADATGTGIADAALQPVGTPPIDGVYWYYGVRIVDNAAKLNANIAWSPEYDPATVPTPPNPSNCRNFFPTDINLKSFLNQAYGQNEIDGLAYKWLDDQNLGPTYTVLQKPWDDSKPSSIQRSDFGYTNAMTNQVCPAEALWRGYGSRLANPGNFQGGQYGLFSAGGPTGRFDRPESGSLQYRGGFVNPDSSASRLEQQAFVVNAGPLGTDSVYASALNFTRDPNDQFRTVTARDAVYWWDYHYNFDGIANNSPLWQQQYQKFPPPYNSNMGIGFAYGLTMDGINPFRTPRALLTANNPVQNISPVVDLTKLPTYLWQAGGGISDSKFMFPYATPDYAPKVSLNTARFEELWRGFFFTMAENLNNEVPFHVPGDLPTDDDTKMFRNPLRATSGSGDPTADPKVSNTGTWGTGAKFDKYNTLLLRAALAAVNAMDIRDADPNTMSGNGKVGNVTSRNITLQATVAGAQKLVQVTVYGGEAQLFITEIFVNTDTIHKGDDNDSPKKVDKENKGGFIAVEVFNPYSFPLDLKDYKIGVIERNSGTPGVMKIRFVGTDGSISPASTGGTTVAAGGSRVLSNYPGGGGAAVGGTPANYVPAAVVTGNANPDFSSWCMVAGLEEVMEGAPTGGGKGGELVLLRRHEPNVPNAKAVDNSYNETRAQDMVPADCYDFTGCVLATPAKDDSVDWHYVRQSGTASDVAWKCVFPGPYNPASKPRFTGTHVTTTPWHPNMMETDPWTMGDTATPISLGTENPTPTFTPVVYPGIPLNDFNWPGTFKPTASNNSFPYGGFARVGDVLQVPFIGAYRVIDPSAPGVIANTSPGGITSDTLVELNPVTMDLLFADARVPGADKARENIGRFCPMITSSINDYDPNGAYPTQTNPSPNPQWYYHWATRVTEAFTVVANPNDDYMPNVDPFADVQTGQPKYPVQPQPIINAPLPAGVTVGNNGKEDWVPNEGLININTASWRVLAAMEMIPRSKDNNGALNRRLAQCIVYYRDVNDGTNPNAPHPHGPFTSVMDLNAVYDPTANNNTFQNALGLLTPTPANPKVGAEWGNFANTAQPPANANVPDQDFISKYIMVNRISNLVTTRSDSFTAYIVVQGWRNIGTREPELVVQKRGAFLIDRSLVTPSDATRVKTYTIPSK